MATLKITELECVKKQETVGKDKIRIEVDGTTLSGPHTMKKNQVLRLSEERDFTGKVPISLYEEDKNSRDDYLGSVYINESHAGLGTLTGNFHHLRGTDYHLKYSVYA